MYDILEGEHIVLRILIKYYPNFLRLVEGYEQSLSLSDEHMMAVGCYFLLTKMGT